MGEIVIAEHGGRPLPVRETECGLPEASSMIVIVPVLVPVVDGVNVTLIIHVSPGLSVAAQV